MQRKEIRRRARRRALRARVIAGMTAIVIGLGLAAGGTALAVAKPSPTLSTPIVNSGGITTYNQNGLVCNSSLIGFQKPSALDGNNLDRDGQYQAVSPNDWGTIRWDVSERRVTWTINAGWDVDICVKGGTRLTVIDTSAVPEATTSYVHTYAGLSHLGFRINSVPSPAPQQDLSCETVTYLKKSPLANGDHVNITVNPPGSQINAYVDQNIEGGYNGLGLRVTAFSVAQPAIPLTQQQVAAGELIFRFADYITSPQWTVTFVQTGAIDTWPNLVCGELTTENFVAPSARMVDITCDAAGSYTLDDAEGIRWFIGSEEVEADRYDVTGEATITARAEAIVPEYALDPEAKSEFTFVFTDPGRCADPTFDGETTTLSQCELDVPWINYSVIVNDPDGRLTSTTASLTFIDPKDANRTHTVAMPGTVEPGTVEPGFRLTGKILWPGASVDAAGNPTGWPGWKQEADGSWVETPREDNFGWTREVTQVTLSVNPSQVMALSYPQPTEDCVGAPKEIAPVATEASCLLDGKAGYELPAIDGVTWYVNGQQRDADFYPVSEPTTVEITFTVDADHPDGPLALAADAPRSFIFEFTDVDLVCNLTTEPTTDASIGFIAPTCDLPERLDPTQFRAVDPTLARYAPELSDLEGPDYAVVFVITDPAAVFYGSSNPVAGRTLSDGGKTLTFSGTLAGPNRGPDCVTVIELKDPVSFIDTCLGASFTLYRVDGIVYTVYRNDDDPVVVNWDANEKTRTYDAAQGDRVRVVPSAASDRYTIAPEPAPFDHTFATYDGDCLPTLPLTEASAQFTPASCLDATNWVTLANEPGVQWWVNGREAAHGTWPLQTGKVVVEATALPGYGFPLEAQTRWEFDVSAMEDDCLPTLAMTGASTNALWLGGAAFLLMSLGTGLLGFRRLRA